MTTRRFTWAASLLNITIAAWSVSACAAAASSPVWARLDLVENTAEGPAFDRCQIEATLERGRTTRWRVFYGEARADSNSGWAAIRSSSGCAPAGSERAAATWTLRGSPYFLVEAVLGQATVSGHEILLVASFSVQTLTGFGKGGVPTYQTRNERRTLRVTEGSGALIPILIASQKETDEFRVRELLLKFRASAVSSRLPVQYGEIAVTADVPRAEIFLDGGFAGRTSSDGAVPIAPVLVGERQIIIQDASGREARALARVEKGRRTSVSLALLKGSPATPDGLLPLGRNPQGAEEFWRGKDGAIVIRVPGGDFQMGSPDGQGEPAERPQHVVRLTPFLLDKTEVTWGQYRRFLKGTGRPPPKPPVWGMPEALPASNITWDDAAAFCAWAGGRLPTEAEWERAARGDDSRPYPWGATWDPWRCNTRDGGPHAPTPAGAYPDCVSPYGVLDLTGSVWEWCSDWYDPSYYSRSPRENPRGPETGAMTPAAGSRPTRVSRGGDWMSPSFSTRSASRQGIEPAWASPMRGFRCAQDDRREIAK